MREAFYEEYLRTLASSGALEAAVERYGIGWIVLPYPIAPELTSRLDRDSRWFLAHALASSRGAYYEIYNYLAAALWRNGRKDEARACYGVVLEDDYGNRVARACLDR